MSVAGVQPKVSVSKVHERVTVPASGLGGRWFAKLPTPAFPSLPENEFVTLEWARRSGIQVPHASLYPANKIENLPAAFDINGPNALLVERFDRQEQTRIHQEDFAQILNIAPNEKYDGEVPADVDYSTIGRIVQVASEGRDAPEFLRRIAFMILSGNADAHVKNWSLTYPDGRRPRLAPAYDLVATIAYPGVGAGLALRLGEGYPLEITASDLVAFAETCGMDVDEASSVLREFVARARTEWDGVRSLAEMPEQVRDAVDGRLAATKL
jgi:serine/threonine-protein kinase HipA